MVISSDYLDFLKLLKAIISAITVVVQTLFVNAVTTKHFVLYEEIKYLNGFVLEIPIDNVLVKFIQGKSVQHRSGVIKLSRKFLRNQCE